MVLLALAKYVHSGAEKSPARAFDRLVRERVRKADDKEPLCTRHRVVLALLEPAR